MGSEGAAQRGAPVARMDVADLPVSVAWVLAGWTLALPLAAWGAWRGEWTRYRENEPVHAFLGALAGMTLLWQVRGSVGGTFAFHLLGSAILALAAGVPRALAGGAVVVALVTALRGAPPQHAAWVWLTLVAVPVGVTGALLRALVAWLPPNIFVYVFAGAFGGGALSLAAAGLAGAAYTMAAAGVPAATVFGDHAPYLVYLAFAEGTLTGMIVTLAVVYRPAWVATFDDARYLRDR